MEMNGAKVAALILCFSVVITAGHLIERDLVHQLLINYDSDSRPIRNGNNSLNVSFMMMLKQIVDLDEKNQILMTQLLVKLEWHDDKLHWDPRNFDNIDQVVLPGTQIWLPDIYVYNNAAGGDKGFIHVNESRAVVKYTGEVMWAVPTTVKSSCSVDVLYFPFDHQFCNLIFASWTYDESQLKLTVEGEGVSTASLLPNSELAIPEVKIVEMLKKATYGDYFYQQIHLKIHIQRKALFYTYTVIAPSILLCVFTIFSFWLPSDNSEKIEMGLTVFLFLYFLQLMIAENTPESNSTPLIGTFLTMVMTLNSVSLIMATLVMHVKNRGENVNCPNVPCWLWFLGNSILGRITLSPFNKSTEQFFVTHASESSSADELEKESNNFITNGDEDSERGSDNCEDTGNGDSGLFQFVETGDLKKKFRGCCDVLIRGGKCKKQDSQNSSNRKRSKKEAAIETRERMYRWLYVAEVMDKFLFEVYLFGTTMAIFVLLIYVPNSYNKQL